jgi:Cof subfamily protein (haloacid dehalogenase superfamily)
MIKGPIPLAVSDLTHIKLVLMDIDGTLIVGSEIELGNVRRQLERLKKRQVEFTVATGRTITGARRVMASLDPKGDVHWIIGYNGGVIAKPDGKPFVERQVIDKASLQRLLEICHELSLPALVYTCADSFDLKEDQEKVFSEPHLFANQRVDFNGMPITRIPSFKKMPSRDVVAVLVSDPLHTGALQWLAERIRKECEATLRVTNSGGAYAEVSHAKATKRTAMEKLCEWLGLKLSQVMAIGDNFNDLEMIAGSGFGVAVANSPDKVKSVSRYVCRQSAAHGV